MKGRAEPPDRDLDPIPAGSPWRLRLRRPVFGSLALAAAFGCLTGPVKQVAVLYDHAPWLNDPFDTVVSFMMFFVPLIAACCVPRVLLCRRAEPLPADRIADVLRGCRVILAGVTLTAGTEWTAVLIGENRAEWNAATAVQVGFLSLLTAGAAVVAAQLRRAGLPAPGAGTSDWLGDLMIVARRLARLAGPCRDLILGLLGRVDDQLIRPARRHPVLASLILCLTFGLVAGGNQGLRENYHVPVTVVVCLLLGSGMFGLITSAGAYLGLVRGSSPPLRGRRRRAMSAAVVTCAAILVPFALRDHLWWLVGSTTAAAGLGQLLQLLALSAVVIFAAGYAGQSAWPSRASTAGPAPAGR